MGFTGWPTLAFLPKCRCPIQPPPPHIQCRPLADVPPHEHTSAPEAAPELELPTVSDDKEDVSPEVTPQKTKNMKVRLDHYRGSASPRDADPFYRCLNPSSASLFDLDLRDAINAYAIPSRRPSAATMTM